jgi:UDPglucose 6-dehydrogenase
MKTIGIVGQGFVGNSVKEGLKKYFKIETYDIIDEKSSVKNLKELFSKSDIMFVCLPTPMKISGECDIKIVDRVFDELNTYGKKTIILKSTVPPGTCDKLSEKYNNLDVVFNPEFLTEANAVDDFVNQDRIVIGGNSEEVLNSVEELFRSAFKSVPILKTDTTTAEMVKYVTNCFLATKVSFANNVYDICKKSDINYDKMIEIVKHDTRVGNSHWMVPGPDGDRGYGGHCFPKDMRAFVYHASTLGYYPLLIDSAIKVNDRIRTNRNWENMKGRAVSDE